MDSPGKSFNPSSGRKDEREHNLALTYDVHFISDLHD